MQCFEYRDIAAGANLKIFKDRKVFADLSNVSQENYYPTDKVNGQFSEKKVQNASNIFEGENKNPHTSIITSSRCGDSSTDIDLSYAEDIYKHLKELELSNRVDLDTLQKRKGISMINRTSLVNWLIESSEKYEFTSQMIHKAVYFIDRYLTLEEIELDEFQELGAIAMFVAYKYESSSPPPSTFFSDESLFGTFSSLQKIPMESKLLKTLDFNLGYPTILSFIDIYCSVFASPLPMAYYMLQYLGELALLDENICAKFLPSEISAACFILANILDHNKPIWPNKLASFTGLELSDLMELVRHLKKFFFLEKSICKSVVIKYSSVKFKLVHLCLYCKNKHLEC